MKLLKFIASPLLLLCFSASSWGNTFGLKAGENVEGSLLTDLDGVGMYIYLVKVPEPEYPYTTYLAYTGEQKLLCSIEGMTSKTELGPEVDYFQKFATETYSLSKDYKKPSWINPELFDLFNAYAAGNLRTKGVDAFNRDIRMQFLDDRVSQDRIGRTELAVWDGNVIELPHDIEKISLTFNRDATDLNGFFSYLSVHYQFEGYSECMRANY